ncbi:hypothetical protein [Mesorhizobium sp. BHbdii]
MPRSPLFGRRIHISGSVVDDVMIAPGADVEAARELVKALVKELIKRGANVVLADITGARPNCFLELGYALGRGLPTMVTVREGASLPFDITTFSGLHWKTSGTVEDKRRAFREHWQAIRNRPSLVPAEPLIS